MERAWIRLCSLDRGDFSSSFGSLEAIAKAIGYNRSALFRAIKALEDGGCLLRHNGDLRLVIPEQPLAKPEPKPQVKPQPKPVEEEVPTIAAEQEAAPRRKNTVNEKEAKTAFVNAWNANKPATYLEERFSMNPATWIAVETQAKRLKVERQDYTDFVKAVCRGLKADEWWAAKSFKVSNVFGYSANIEDKKFQSVEKLWKQGQTKEAARATFTGSAADFIEWYNSKGFSVKTVTAVNVQTWEEGHEQEQTFLQQNTNVDRSAARVYYADNKPVYWSGKMSQKPLYYLP
jgi:biotin operon repressor